MLLLWGVVLLLLAISCRSWVGVGVVVMLLLWKQLLLILLLMVTWMVGGLCPLLLLLQLWQLFFFLLGLFILGAFGPPPATPVVYGRDWGRQWGSVGSRIPKGCRADGCCRAVAWR